MLQLLSMRFCSFFAVFLFVFFLCIWVPLLFFFFWELSQLPTVEFFSLGSGHGTTRDYCIWCSSCTKWFSPFAAQNTPRNSGYGLFPHWILSDGAGHGFRGHSFPAHVCQKAGTWWKIENSLPGRLFRRSFIFPFPSPRNQLIVTQVTMRSTLIFQERKGCGTTERARTRRFRQGLNAIHLVQNIIVIDARQIYRWCSCQIWELRPRYRPRNELQDSYWPITWEDLCQW